MIPINKGYVSIHREIVDHWVWEDRPFSYGQAWIDLILLANHKTEKFPYKGGIIEGQRGTVYRSLSFLADRWGWSRDKVRRFIRLLECDGMVRVNTTTHNTTVTLVNYGKFQDQVTTNRQQIDSKPTANRQQAATYNNSNNSNNSNNKKKGTFVPPTFTEVETYCLESGHKIDINAFIDFYTSKNWFVGKNKMKDWKAAVRSWERRDKERKGFQNFKSSGTDWNEAAYKIMGY